MSWSASTVGRSGDDITQKVYSLDITHEHGVEVDDALGIAQDIALDLIESGALGEGDDKIWSVSLSGHANPGNEPVSGWSNDSISINVWQADESYLEQYEKNLAAVAETN